MMSDGGDMTEKSTALIVTELEFDEREREELVLLGLVWLVRVVEVVVVEWVLNGSLGRHPLQERNRNREEGEELRKREGILVTREMGGQSQAVCSGVVFVLAA
jgi:hypothetical protein